MIQQSLSTAIKAQLTAGQVVNVSISPAAAIPLVGSMASTSSRGPSISGQSIKPEIGAPGGSVSAEVGTGDGQTAFSGTSGAAPMVAGAAALMVQAFPNRSPEKIKAMLMNSAETTVYTNPAVLPGELAPITRIGAGELRVNRAIAQTAIAWNRATKSAALSFGALEVESHMVVERTLRVENFAKTARNFSITPSFRYANDEASGAVKVQVKSSVHVSAGGHEDVEVKLIIDPNKLPTWMLNGGSGGGDGAALNGPEYDGYITLTAGSEKITVPWHVLPRKAAETDATLSDKGKPGPTVKLRNRGAEFGDYEVFSLTGVSRRIPRSELPGPGDNFAVIDMRAVGVRHLPAAVFGADYLEFAINTNGRQSASELPGGVRHLSGYHRRRRARLRGLQRGERRLWGDGSELDLPRQPDHRCGDGVFLHGRRSQFRQRHHDRADGADAARCWKDDRYRRVCLRQLLQWQPDRRNHRHAVHSGHPPLWGGGSVPWGTVPSKGSLDLGVTTATIPDALSSELGLLMMYRRNAGQEADVVRIR